MTVASRTFRSSPHRDAAQTWDAIVDLLTTVNKAARSELTAVGGIVCSLISDRSPQSAPIIVTCDGPRTRIYCIYDDNAVDGTDAREDALGFDPLKGNWQISLPCPKDELNWVETALAKHSNRVTARDMKNSKVSDDHKSHTLSLTLDVEEFLKS